MVGVIYMTKEEIDALRKEARDADGSILGINNSYLGGYEWRLLNSFEAYETKRTVEERIPSNFSERDRKVWLMGWADAEGDLNFF